MLGSQGVKEIILISQDTTSYGQDLGIHEGLASLLESLGKINGIQWIRFLYVYPNLVSDRLIEAIRFADTSICPYSMSAAVY